jgi:uncharacterized membrane protein
MNVFYRCERLSLSHFEDNENEKKEKNVMKQLAKFCTWAGLAATVIGAVSRLIVVPIIVTSRVWAGGAVILLLFAIALAELYE